MFKSAGQRAAVCETLCVWNEWPSLWCSTGPSDRTQGIVEGRLAAFAPVEQALAPVVWALWRGDPQVSVNIQKLPAATLLSVATLLEALAYGGDAVDQWIEEHNADGIELDASFAMTAS